MADVPAGELSPGEMARLTAPVRKLLLALEPDGPEAAPSAASSPRCTLSLGLTREDWGEGFSRKPRMVHRARQWARESPPPRSWVAPFTQSDG